ncbi:hypothetical protein JCM30204_23590 [Dysgonomonas termitidis]
MRLADVSSLSVGMTQNEVNQIMGAPIRVLSSSYTQDGQLDVYEYYTYRNEAYAIEFWNGRLSRYDFMYEDVPPAGISPRPPYTTYPNRPMPNRPSQPNRPENNRPSNRPDNNTSNSGRPSTRPTEDNKPGNSGRPSSGGTERPSYGSGNSTSSRSSTPAKEQSKQTEGTEDKK